ncbi:hypothetical protein A6283_12925 [Bacillus wiedmannii]|uniref:hypothetical protein n=1 Tax=Bacillus wiedmannii TaxID=1890302 RepID=UPI0007DB0D3A|nr:hypothetical protein [Bacillus wiedmannii]OAK18923.1 hypothetical protein A6283_12925 [Bacillus wiedmannii]OAK39101.1 hypothetical protein A6286_07260 [Bacillus wiedmannii]PHB68232.1 hypothetical protein COE89_26125 [Bacillus wiedmannii]
MFNLSTYHGDGNADSFNIDGFFPELKKTVKTTVHQTISNVIFKAIAPIASLSTWEENDSSQITINLINDMFVINNYKEVTDFLYTHDYLLALILKSRIVIHTHFVEKPKLELRLEETDESPNAKKLYVIIHSNLDLESAYHLLQKVDAEWWIDASTASKSKMNIDLEY